MESSRIGSSDRASINENDAINVAERSIQCDRCANGRQSRRRKGLAHAEALILVMLITIVLAGFAMGVGFARGRTESPAIALAICFGFPFIFFAAWIGIVSFVAVILSRFDRREGFREAFGGCFGATIVPLWLVMGVGFAAQLVYRVFSAFFS